MTDSATPMPGSRLGEGARAHRERAPFAAGCGLWSTPTLRVPGRASAIGRATGAAAGGSASRASRAAEPRAGPALGPSRSSRVIRRPLHPEGLAARIRQLLLGRSQLVARRRAAAADRGVAAAPAPTVPLAAPDGTPRALVMTVTMVGMPHAIGLEDLAIAALLRADAAAAAAPRRRHEARLERPAGADGRAPGVTLRPARAYPR